MSALEALPFRWWASGLLGCAPNSAAFLPRLQGLIDQWQEQLPTVKIVLGGSLVSQTFVMEGATAIDVDIRFLADVPTEAMVAEIEAVTGLKYRKTISVSDHPNGTSVGYMIEGKMDVPWADLPLDIEGCLRNKAYVGWAKFYPEVLSAEELAQFTQAKADLRAYGKETYKALKAMVLTVVQERVLAKGLLKSSLKVVVAGPPQSGKSVFLGGLVKNLPRGETYLFRACPDGEGSWTYVNDASATYRRKGKFASEVVDWYIDCLKSVNLAPIVLVDIGGIASPENRRIIKEGGIKHAIILTRNHETATQWREFLTSCGVEEIIATVLSDYNGSSDTMEGETLIAHHLDRKDTTVDARPVIEHVAARLLELAPAWHAASESDTIQISEMAATLGKAKVTKILPNGKAVTSVEWASQDLLAIQHHLRADGWAEKSEVRINGAAPGMVVSCMATTLGGVVRVNSPDGYVQVGCQAAPNQAIEATLKGRVLTIQSADPSRPFKSSDLMAMPLPEVAPHGMLAISGRLPLWMLASIVKHYSTRVAAVATHQPGIGFTVVHTNVRSIDVGTFVAEGEI